MATVVCYVSNHFIAAQRRAKYTFLGLYVDPVQSNVGTKDGRIYPSTTVDPDILCHFHPSGN